MSKVSVAAFKAYDVRGRVPEQLNDEIAYRTGRAYAEFLKPKKVVVGHDIRLSSPQLSAALCRGLIDGGAQITDIGQCGTEMIYFATTHLKQDGGIMITASHNPAEYNGLKFVREGSRPISGDSGLNEIRDLVAEADYRESHDEALFKQNYRTLDVYPAYAEHLKGYLNPEKLTKLKVVVNPGNGVAGRMIDAVAQYLPYELVKVNYEPDGHFPHGVPNPLLPENRAATAQAVLESKAALGVAWDGDADRCFFFDEQGRFIEGYYIVGLLAEAFLSKDPKARIIHDPRLTWNTQDIVTSRGGTPIESKTGHAFIKERMRAEDAVYGGEMSAHHYFRDFSYCDSGMLPYLLLTELLCSKQCTLSSLVEEAERKYPISGEINSTVKDVESVIKRVWDKYAPQAQRTSQVDGISVEFERWRFNLRASNTEPVVRLNVESRGDAALVRERTDELLALIRA
ncbi:MAG: phosphomannomutase CpsG [Succinivibrio sp.]|nr:phosphomannomutase CpsG [Succinivibrio sp.]